MKVVVMHDDHGRIRGTFATRTKNVGVNATAGLRLHAFDHDELSDTALKAYLHELHTQYRVDPKNSALVKIDASPDGGKA